MSSAGTDDLSRSNRDLCHWLCKSIYRRASFERVSQIQRTLNPDADPGLQIPESEAQSAALTFSSLWYLRLSTQGRRGNDLKAQERLLSLTVTVDSPVSIFRRDYEVDTSTVFLYTANLVRAD